MRFSEEKGLCTKMALTSFLEYFPKVPGWQNEPIPQGQVPQSKMESAKNLSMGEKVVKSLKKLGEDIIFSSSLCSSLKTQNFKSNLIFYFFIFLPSLFLIIPLMIQLYLAEGKISKCLGHFWEFMEIEAPPFDRSSSSQILYKQTR